MHGTHVPFVASWPARIEGGAVVDDLVDFADILPTFAELADVPADVGKELEWDGVSLAPLLTGEGTREKDHIYCWYERNGERADASEHVLDQAWKLYDDGRLYHVAEDRWEKTDLSGELEENPEAKAAHARLLPALERHMEVTRQVDERQAERREELQRGDPVP